MTQFDQRAELDAHLDEELVDAAPAGRAVAQAMARGHKVVRRRRGALAGIGAVAVGAAIALPLSLTHSGGPTPQAGGGHGGGVVASKQLGIAPAPLPSDVTTPPPPPAAVKQQQVIQSLLTTRLRALGATVTATDPSLPELTSDEISAGVNITLAGRSGYVGVNISRAGDISATANPCDVYTSVGEPAPKCTKTAAPDGSTIWSWTLPAGNPGITAIDTMNVRSTEEVTIQTTNFPLQNGVTFQAAQTTTVLSQYQAEAVAADPGFVLPQ